jgi:hypothetical protein
VPGPVRATGWALLQHHGFGFLLIQQRRPQGGPERVGIERKQCERNGQPCDQQYVTVCGCTSFSYVLLPKTPKPLIEQKCEEYSLLLINSCE